MTSLEFKKKKKIAETEEQVAAFKVNDRRSGQEYEVVMDESGNKQILNREEKVVELENKIRETEKQEVAKKLSQEKTNLIKGIKELESEFKNPGIKSKKTFIEKSILEKEVKVREIENQLRPTKKEKEDKKEKLPESGEVDQNKPEAIDNKKEEEKAEEKEVGQDNNPVIKSEGGITPTEEINPDNSDIITAEKEGESKKENKEKLPEQTIEEKGERKQIEYQGESLEEKKQKIEKLWLEVEKARKEYLEKDYKNNTGLARVKNFFGAFLKKDKDGAGFQSEKELTEYRAYYDNSLLEHKKAMLDEARLRGASGKELLDIAKFYQVEANINLADVHDQVKIENQEGKISGFIKEHSQELIERYKKMHWAKKIAIGAAFGIAGAGAIYIGGAAVGIAGSAIAARRAIMGVITGTTVSLGFEAWGKKKTEKKIQKEMEKLEKNMTGLSEEEKNKILEGFIDKDIQDEDQKINKIKNKNLRHLAYGVAAGLGTMLAPKITRLFSEGAAPGGSIPEHSGGQNVPIGESGAPKMPGVVGASEQAVPGVENIIVEVQKGDSLWKIIGKQLEEKYQNYADLNEAQKIHVIDALKDKVAADPGKFGLDNIDKLKAGQKIDLSEIFRDRQPENLITEAQNLNEDQMQSILENRPKLREWVEANPGEELTLEKPEEILKEFEGAEDAPAASSFEEVPGDSETPEGSSVEETPKAEEVKEVPETSEESSVEDNPDVNKQEEEPEIKFEKKVKK